MLGGWVTEMAPSALPEGVSPDCQDVDFLPGSVYSRPCLHKVFGTPFPAGGPNNFVPTVVYGKSFVTATGVIKNLYLDSNGVMWVEDFTNTPGTYTQLFTTTPGSYCKSVTAFGREWMAISDGLNPTDTAYQYDGASIARMTQDGPGAGPNVASIGLPSSTLAGSGGGAAGSVTSLNLTNGGSGYSFGAHVIISGGGGSGASAYAYTSGGQVTSLVLFGGGSGYTSAPAVSIIGNSGGSGATATAAITGGGGGGGGTIGLQRANNLVTATTTAAHGLQIGYQAQISNVAASTVGGSVSSIVIDNESLPGIAVVTTSSAHGLYPGNDVSITGVTPVSVGGATNATSNGYLTTLATTTAHGLVPGTSIKVSGFTGADTIFNGTFTIFQVPTTTTIAYYQSLYSTTATTAGPTTTTLPQSVSSGSTGAVSLTWPIPDNTPTPTFFTVLSTPTPTTFQVQVTYSDGTWGSGIVKFGWEGIFYVASVPTATTFTYQQYGPNATSMVAGTVTPYGQCSPGLHLVQLLYLLKDGTITAPSPPISFIANGGQYVSVTNIATGPSNVQARIVAFTGAQPNVPGILPPFFYIPVPAQVQGQIVSTATQVNDNTTASVLMDFADNSLFAAVGISVTGNTPVNQIVLDGALGFAYFQSRLTTWGQRNAVTNLLNMGFDGGTLPATPTSPTGWSSTLVQVATGKNGLGGALQFTGVLGPGNVRQRAYQDAYGNPILEPNTRYKVRFWCASSGVNSNANMFFEFNSSSTVGFDQIILFTPGDLPGPSGAWMEAEFSNPTPGSIPTDGTFGINTNSLSTGYITIDEVTLFSADQPYLSTQSFTSYVNNPTGFDGVTGNMQPTEDTRKIMDFSILRGTPYAHTQDPSGRLHEILVNPTSEPIGWAWKEVSANCGTLSAFGVTKSQADDYTGSGGDDWLAWPSEGGATIFDGSEPKKISQEIQPSWNDPTSTAWPQINMQYAQTAWGLNDPITRTLYFGLPLLFGASIIDSAPGIIYALSYRELNSAYAIANSPPFHPSLSGKLVATDNTRKWSPWKMTMNGGARMYRSAGQLTTVFFAGNRLAPGDSGGKGNVYTLSPNLLTDDDYGKVNPYYTTCFMVEPEKAAAIGLGSVRLMLAYLTAFVSGTGTVTYTFLCDSLSNPWSITTTRALTTSPRFDQEAGGGLAQGNRIAIKIASSPTAGTDNGFNLQRLQAFFKKAKMQIRGAAQ